MTLFVSSMNGFIADEIDLSWYRIINIAASILLSDQGRMAGFFKACVQVRTRAGATRRAF